MWGKESRGRSVKKGVCVGKVQGGLGRVREGRKAVGGVLKKGIGITNVQRGE